MHQQFWEMKFEAEVDVSHCCNHFVKRDVPAFDG